MLDQTGPASPRSIELAMSSTAVPPYPSPPTDLPLNERGRAYEELLRERILVLDGAMGTQIQAADLTADDFGGPELEGCNEHLVVTRPEVIKGIHRAYFEAGADIVETDTFGST